MEGGREGGRWRNQEMRGEKQTENEKNEGGCRHEEIMLFPLPIMLFPNSPAVPQLCSQPVPIMLKLCSILVVELPFNSVVIIDLLAVVASVSDSDSLLRPFLLQNREF